MSLILSPMMKSFLSHKVPTGLPFTVENVLPNVVRHGFQWEVNYVGTVKVVVSLDGDFVCVKSFQKIYFVGFLVTENCPL